MRIRPGHVEPGLAVAWALALSFAVIFGALSIRQHNGFGSMAFDLGIYDQGFWLVSRGKSFVTVRGLDFWGHHLNLIAFAYAPFYWLGAGARFLLASQALMLGLGAVPVYLIARRSSGRQAVGIIFAWLYLLYPPVQWLTHANFHPEALAVTPLLFAWWYLGAQRWRPFAVAAAIALAMREDVALVLAMMGLAMIVVGGRDPAGEGDTERKGWTEREVGILLVLMTGWYYFAATNAIIPHFNQGRQPFYIAAFYGQWGTSGTDVAVNLIRHPGRFASAASQPDARGFYGGLFAPWGWTPLAGPAALVAAVPQLIASTIANIPFPRSIRYQYTSVMIAPITVAAIEGVSFLGRLARRHSARTGRIGAMVVIGWVALSMIVSNVTASPAPWARHAGEWWKPNGYSAAVAEAIEVIPPTDSVSAQFNIVPHLDHRAEIYDWPNPWIESNWGVDDRYRYPDPATVDWVVLTPYTLSPEEREVFEGLVGLQFEVVYAQGGVVVLHRLSTP